MTGIERGGRLIRHVRSIPVGPDSEPVARSRAAMSQPARVRLRFVLFSDGRGDEQQQRRPRYVGGNVIASALGCLDLNPLQEPARWVTILRP